jgi:hypothetical protein
MFPVFGGHVIKCVLLFLFIASSGALAAQSCVQTAASFQSWVSKGEPYSVAECQGSDPQQVFRQANAELMEATAYRHDPTHSFQLNQLAKAAKAALEAGLLGAGRKVFALR